MKSLLVAILGVVAFAGAPVLRSPAPSFADADAARRAGYEFQTVSGAVEHWVNPAYFNDGHERDAARPEALMYLRTPNGLELQALVFVLDHDEVGTAHRHRACIGQGGLGVPLPGGPCPPGTLLQETPPMVHVWMSSAPEFCRLTP